MGQPLPAPLSALLEGMAESSVETFRAAIVRACPELSGASFAVLALGWDSIAVEVDDRLIFKFPRNETAERSLVMEAALLAEIRAAVAMRVPDMTIHHGPPLFSRHAKIEGEHLPAGHYRDLKPEARRFLGTDLGQFYAELHRFDVGRMTACGAVPIKSWPSADMVRARALPLVPRNLRTMAEMAIDRFERLPQDPYGNIYGFFDGHGWNMAFDHTCGRLNGIYDFADSGIGPVHQDFIYSNFISFDLTERIVAAYEDRTGRILDRARIDLLTGFHRLGEIADRTDDPDHVENALINFTDWAARKG
jgi:hypothetical protein